MPLRGFLVAPSTSWVGDRQGELLAPSSQAANSKVPTVFHGTLDFFSSGWPVAYFIAAAVLGIGLLIGAFTYVSRPEEVVHKDQSPPGYETPSSPKAETVGRITGMADCKWPDLQADATVGDRVELGRTFTLASGLMEITYDTGAKVLLQGPVSYNVESFNGGFISLGKLAGEASTESARGLTIRTPTATVVDLGTEFGVEVGRDGHTVSRVYRGSVQLRALSRNGTADGDAKVLRENESARVDLRGERAIVSSPSGKPVDFVRSILRSSGQARVLDLVDIVAGGNGFSGRRNAGIDATTGKPSNRPPKPENFFVTGDHKYHRVTGLPFVDGVFIPDGSRGPVQVDSGGHVCDMFTKTANMTGGYFWTGGPIPVEKREYHIPTTLSGVDYASFGHGLLFMHANKGITFDLDAIRRAHHGWKPLRFRAVAGNSIGESMMGLELADFWVIVDGQVRFQRYAVNGHSGAFVIHLRIGETDRFLTLAATNSTDSSSGISGDWTMFGDPRLDLVPVRSTAGPTLPGKHSLLDHERKVDREKP